MGKSSREWWKAHNPLLSKGRTFFTPSVQKPGCYRFLAVVRLTAVSVAPLTPFYHHLYLPVRYTRLSIQQIGQWAVEEWQKAKSFIHWVQKSSHLFLKCRQLHKIIKHPTLLDQRHFLLMSFSKIYLEKSIQLYFPCLVLNCLIHLS